jgi:tight adherence protein C
VTPTATAVCVAALSVVAVAAVVRSFRPAPLTLRAVRARIEPQQTATSSALPVRIGRPLAAGPLGVFVDTRLGSALTLTGYTVPTVIGAVTITVVASAFAMVVAVAALIATGQVASPLVWLLVPIVAAVFGWRVIADIRTRAARRRVELDRVVNDFVQLLAIALTTNRSVEDALTFAADVGDGFGFDLLRQTIDTAQPMGLTVWDALAAMADTYDLDQLGGLATSLQRQAGVGISVAATIRTEAKAMRARQLADITDRADKANANLSLPTMGMVVGMVLFLAYPVMQQISEAFT